MRSKYLEIPVSEGGLTGGWEDEVELVFINTLNPAIAIHTQVKSLLFSIKISYNKDTYMIVFSLGM